jgi:hypothetical protein
MTRALGAFALAAVVAACSSGEPVQLLTSSGSQGCFLANTTGRLVTDADAGTAIVQEDMAKLTVPVVWPEGYAGRRSGSQVRILDATGKVVATTGERYVLLGGYGGDGSWVTCADGVYPPE